MITVRKRKEVCLNSEKTVLENQRWIRKQSTTTHITIHLQNQSHHSSLSEELNDTTNRFAIILGSNFVQSERQTQDVVRERFAHWQVGVRYKGKHLVRFWATVDRQSTLEPRVKLSGLTVSSTEILPSRFFTRNGVDLGDMIS